MSRMIEVVPRDCEIISENIVIIVIVVKISDGFHFEDLRSNLATKAIWHARRSLSAPFSTLNFCVAGLRYFMISAAILKPVEMCKMIGWGKPTYSCNNFDAVRFRWVRSKEIMLC